MTRFTKTLVALTSIAVAVATTSTTAHAGDTFKASFNYDKAASAEVNLDSFKKTASTICTQQLVEAGFRKTDTTSFQQRKCERALVKKAVKGTNDTVLMTLYKSGGNAPKTVQMAMNTK